MKAGSACLVVLSVLVCAGFVRSSRLITNSLATNGAADQLEESIAFLRTHMPSRDVNKVSDDFIMSTASLSLSARKDNIWAASVPWKLFLDYVLPYANLDEPREDWRSVFYPTFKPLVAETSSLAEAALRLNQDIWKIWGIHFKSDQAPEILSPSQVIKAGYGSCSALSIFLVNACRSVGIPARVAGTPCWLPPARPATGAATAERFNNHNWVEVWDGSSWSFMGAAEWVPEGFNRTWFFPEPARRQVPGSLMHAIYAATFRRSEGCSSGGGGGGAGRSLLGGAGGDGVYFPLAWDADDHSVPAIDVTQHYLDTPVPALLLSDAAGGAGVQQPPTAAVV